MRIIAITLGAVLSTASGLAAAGRPSAPAAAVQHSHATADLGETWTSYPLIVPGPPSRAPEGASTAGRPRMDRLTAGLTVRNLDTGSVEAIAPLPDAVPTSFSVNDGRAWIAPVAPDAGNYYWVRARQLNGDRLTVASTVWYFSNPGPSPKRLLLREKSELEIIPQPLPREHSSYRESDVRRFLVRFEGQPLSGAKVALETEHGSKASYASDARGFVTVTFPHDFPARAGEHGADGHMGPPRAKFVLAAEHDTADRRYLTAFNYVYSPHPDTGKNYWAGIGFGVLGMLLATPLLRRRGSANEKKAG
jgi:hypothetical protein